MKDFNDIKPSKEQENCISYRSGDLLVNGVPGAGKSIVLLKRALEFYKASRPGERRVVLITTFSNTLKDYTNDIFQQADIDSGRMSITTIDWYCAKIYRQLFGRFNIVPDSERERAVSQALQNHYRKSGKSHRFYDVDEKFWCEEFLWIKQKNLRTPQQYYEAERTGRGSGVRITREERKTVYELFEEYCRMLKQRHLDDWEDLYIRIINEASGKLAQFKYKYVMIDEAQDLSYVKLKVAKMLATDSVTIAADKAQKIYNTGFTWKELGIDVRGNASKTLHKTFRSTKQIVQLAESLMEINRAREGDKGEYTETVLPAILGEDYPNIIRCSNLADHADFLNKLINKLLADDITIGLLYRNYIEKDRITRFLNSRGIRYQEIRKDTEWSLRRKGVKLATLHSSKGLEFDIVIIPCFDSVFYPLQTEIEKADAEQIEEVKAKERNLLYVGMTRAKSALYLTYFGKESEFLYEFNPEYYNYTTSSGTELNKPKRSFSPSAVIKENDTIRAHYEGSNESRELSGKGVQDWAFAGKKVGDRVPGMNHVYVIDEIVEHTTPAKKPAKKDGWEDVKDYIDRSCRKYIKKLISFGVPAPTTVGSELMGPDGDVIAEAELAWEKEKTVFLRKDQIQFKKDWTDKGWTVITEDTPVSSVKLSEVKK